MTCDVCCIASRVVCFQIICIDQHSHYNLISSSLLSSGLPFDGGDWLRACSADICNTASVPGKPSSAVVDLSVSGGSAISNNLIERYKSNDYFPLLYIHLRVNGGSNLSIIRLKDHETNIRLDIREHCDNRL